MASYNAGTGNGGFFTTGRLMMLAAILLVGGVAAPRLKDLTYMLPGGESATVAGRLSYMQNSARTITTRQRMKGVKASLRLWSAQHGAPGADDLVPAVGKETATDGWGRLILLTPPTSDTAGCLRSLGADGKRSSDDITLSVSWSDLNRPRIAPGWQ